MSHPIQPILASLGFSDSEARVYLAGLKGGSQTVIDLAKETNLSRQTVYDAISQLTQRGLISTAERGKRTCYTAESPERLLAYAKRQEGLFQERIQILEKAVPSLTLEMGGDRPIVKLFEGKEGIHGIIEELRDVKPKELDEMVDGYAMMGILTDDDLVPYRTTMKQFKTHMRGIIAGDIRPSPKGKTGCRRQLPREDWNFKCNIQVTEDFVAFSTFAGKMYSVSIKDPYIARAMKILFHHARKGIGGEDR